MDPDECLKQIRATVNSILDDSPPSLWTSELNEQAVRLALITLCGDFRDLDNWIQAGGFLPDAWGKHWPGARS